MVKKHNTNKEFEALTEPTREEIDALRVALTTVSQKRIFGKLYPRIDLYAEARGYVRIAEDGFHVRDPKEYTRLRQMHKKIQDQDHRKREQLFEQFPEERQKHIDFIRSLRPTGQVLKRMPQVDEMEF